MIPVSILDNFFENPDEIREFALKQSYSKKYAVPGYRTDPLHIIAPRLFDIFAARVFALFFDFDAEPSINWNMSASFQWVPAVYETGWVHTDDIEKTNISGVVYLTPDAPLDGGTSVYRPTSRTRDIDDGPKAPFYDFYTSERKDSFPDLENYRLARDTHNAKFDKTISISNVYNRLFTYNTYDYHSEDKFFGNTLKDSRLTLVFFAQTSGVRSPDYRYSNIQRRQNYVQ
jgi:hypothetical protein